MNTQEKHPPSFTFGEAAKRFTISKSTLSKDRKSGKLSATSQADGSYAVGYDELLRVYGDKLKLRTVEETGGSNDAQPLEQPRETPGEIVLKAKLDAAERRITDLETERDKWHDAFQKQQETAANALRQLEDRREKPPETPPEPPRGFWARLLGRAA